MERTPSSTTGQQELVDTIVKATEKQALEEAGKSEERVSEVSAIQKKQVHALLADPSGSGQNDELITETSQAIDEAHAERMQSIEAAPDAYVFSRTDATAGVQHDGTKEIGIAGDVLQDPESANRVSRHEAAHREQEDGAESFGFTNEDGEMIEVRRLDLREDDAIRAEGGLSNHTPEYHEYVQHAGDVAGKLDEAGENGTAMVAEAARTQDGFKKVRQKLIEKSVRDKLEKELALAA